MESLIASVVYLLLVPAVLLLLLRRYVPMIGNPLWQLYRRLLTWLVVAPIRLIRMLAREALGRRP